MLNRTRQAFSGSRGLWRWGSNGNELSKLPCFVGDIDAVSMSHGQDHSALVDSTGTVLTYGSNKYDQLGRDTNDDMGPVDSSSVAATSVSCGAWHTVSLHSDGSVRSFGWGGSFFGGAGALGHGSKMSMKESTKIEFFNTNSEKIQQVACGAQHTLFLTESHLLFATGHGAYGILGNGDSNDELAPVEIAALNQCLGAEEKVKKIAAGHSFSVILTNQGNLLVWGRNDHGQLGLGEESQGDMHSAERYPRRIPFFETQRTVIKDVVCGDNHVVALADNGAIYYWGDRTWLEPHLVTLPEANGGIQNIKKIVAGNKYSFVLTNEGLVYTWGAKNSGCLILQDLKKNPITPNPVHPAFFDHQRVLDISAGGQRCSAVTAQDEFVVTNDADAEKLQKSLKDKQCLEKVSVLESH
jgi:alpha-tubulin suppressor-like RCC1 family protein